MSGLPSVFDRFVFDPVTAKTWPLMTDAERAASTRVPRRLVWNGANVSSGAFSVLTSGTPRVAIAGPAAGAAATTYPIGLATFGPPLGAAGVAGTLMPVLDTIDGLGLACTPLDALNALAVNGRVALIDEDPSAACSATTQVKNVQNAGGAAVVLIDSGSLPQPGPISGSDPTVTIASARIAHADGAILKTALAHRSRSQSGVTADLRVVATQLLGADLSARPFLFGADPPQNPAHWDLTATPNQLMEPTIAGDVLHSVVPPADLTFRALQDIGW
jgi:hypothetical protein